LSKASTPCGVVGISPSFTEKAAAANKERTIETVNFILIFVKRLTEVYTVTQFKFKFKNTTQAGNGVATHPLKDTEPHLQELPHRWQSC